MKALSRRARQTLKSYEKALPGREFAALQAWLSTFYPFQLEWLLDGSKRAITNKSRQIGMSHTTAAVAVLWGVFHGELTTVISIGEAEAVEVLDKAKKHAEILAEFGSQMAKLTRSKETGIGFASGGRVLALPSTGGRGYSGNVFLDEFAYHQNPGKVWDAAVPATGLGFRLRVASTPNGFGNDFQLLWRDAEALEFSAHEIPIALAIEQGFPVDLKECWSLAKGDPRLFAQMYECRFLDGELQYLPSELIEPCLRSGEELSGDSGSFVAGLDVGKTADKTVLVVLRRTSGVSRLAYIESHKRTDAQGLQDMVARAFERFGLVKLCVDSTGIGSFPAEEMQNRHGFYEVDPVTFTLKSKEQLATGLYTAFSEKSLLLPKNDNDIPEPPEGMKPVKPGSAKMLVEDLCSIQRIITNAGNVRYDAPHTAEGHADSAWALALAQKAANEVVEYQPVNSLGALF